MAINDNTVHVGGVPVNFTLRPNVSNRVCQPNDALLGKEHGVNASVCLAGNNRLLILRQGLWLDEMLYGIVNPRHVANVNPRTW